MDTSTNELWFAPNFHDTNHKTKKRRISIALLLNRLRKDVGLTCDVGDVCSPWLNAKQE
jgi:predicted transport protein